MRPNLVALVQKPKKPVGGASVGVGFSLDLGGLGWTAVGFGLGWFGYEYYKGKK